MESIITSSDDEETPVLLEEKKGEVVDTESATTKKVAPLSSTSTKKGKYKEKRFSEDDETPSGNDIEMFPEDAEGLVSSPPDFVINEDIDAEMHDAVKKQHAFE